MLKGSATSISRTEFRALLGRTIQPNDHIAVAVSGGADSISLALLLHSYFCGISSGYASKHLHTFTVDHRLRRVSAEEAQAVHQLLRHRGLNHKVLTVPTLPTGGGIEKHARVARYTALTRACLSNRITKLFLGHHADDQYEGILLRLVAGGAWGTLTGMPHVAENPLSNSLHSSRLVQLHRPLLDISKDRLMQTCRDFGVEWFEDKTNADPCLTPRNALRSILATSSLPQALQKCSILSLAQDLNARHSELERHTKALWQTSRTGEGQRNIAFDTRTGHVDFRLSSFQRCESVHLRESFVREVCMLVSPSTPRSSTSISSLVSFLATPRTSQCSRSMNSVHDQQSKLRGACAENLESKYDETQRCGMIWTIWRNPADELNADEFTCSVFRQPLQQSEIQLNPRSIAVWSPPIPTSTRLTSPSSSVSQQLPENPKDSERKNGENGRKKWDGWVLWDHRWWIRVSLNRSISSTHAPRAPDSNTPHADVIVRNMQKKDIKAVRALVGTHAHNGSVGSRTGHANHQAVVAQMRESLQSHAVMPMSRTTGPSVEQAPPSPSPLPSLSTSSSSSSADALADFFHVAKAWRRFTCPVLVLPDHHSHKYDHDHNHDHNHERGIERVIALPTLGIGDAHYTVECEHVSQHKAPEGYLYTNDGL